LNATSIGVMADGQRTGAVSVDGLGREQLGRGDDRAVRWLEKPTATPIAKVNFA
jgi:hypothetical protein